MAGNPQTDENETDPEILDPSNEVDRVDSEIDESAFIDFAKFFGEEGETVIVQLYRLEPKRLGDTQIEGFQRNLSVDEMDDALQIIKDEFGGGKYIVRQRVNNKFGKQQVFRIGGPPLVSCQPRGAEPIIEPTTAPPGGIQLEVEGIGIDIGDLKKLKEIAVFKAAIDQLFPPKQDINETLLSLVIQKNEPAPVVDPLAQIETLTSISKKIQEMSGGGGGSLLESILPEALKTVQSIAGAVNRPQPNPVKPQPRTAPKQIPNTGTVQENHENSPAPQPELQPENAQEAEEMGHTEIAQTASAYIVQGFLLNPLQPEQQTKNVLDLVLPTLIPEHRSRLNPFKGTIRDMARMTLSSQVETTPDMLEEFNIYFDEVYRLFVDNVESENETQTESAGDDHLKNPPTTDEDNETGQAPGKTDI
jgi:hypothetical protein